MATTLETLLRRITDSGLLDDPIADDDAVRGDARLDGPGADVTIIVDPELDEIDDPDIDALIEALERISGLSEARWRAIVETVAVEIEDATGDDEAAEQIDPREDLEVTWVTVFADAVLLAFTAEKQFPESRVLVQLDSDLEVEDVEVVADSDVEEPDED